MIKHYLKIGLRNLARQKVLSLINILGLSIGLACFSLFLLYAVNEFNFDRFNKNADNVFRVYRWSDAMNGEAASGYADMPSPVGPAMKKDIPDVAAFVRFRDAWGQSFVKVNDVVTRMNLSYADPAIFSVFTFPFKYGLPQTALKDLHSIVITRSKARDLFGDENVVGRSLEIKIDDQFVPFSISGVAENIPANSSITFEMLGNFDFMETTASGKSGINNWRRSAYSTFVQLQPGSGLMNNTQKLVAFRHTYYPTEEDELRKAGVKWTGNIPPIRFGLEPLKAIHTGNISGGSIDNVNPKTIWILLSIAAAVLLIACINFTTLAIGRSAHRAKEIGLRKVIGGGRKQLITQFLSESVLLSIISAVIGLLLAILLLPYFNKLSGRELRFSFTYYPEMAWMLAGLTVLVGLLAGSYPAFILSGFKPIQVLKSKIKISGANIFTRSLVTIQFALSVGLIICTMIILKQTKFMSSKNPGFNKENVVVVDAEGTDTKKVYPLFKQSLLAENSIKGIASSELGLGEGTGWSRSGFEYNGAHKNVFEYFIDNDYIKVMGMQVIAGRNFDPTIADDTVTSVIVNEAMVKDFGWTTTNAVGQQLKGYSEEKTPVVIGVVKDFNFRPLKEKIEPQMFHQFADYAPFKFFVRISAGNPAPALATINKVWAGIVPDLPLKYSFLDENLDHFYKSERRWSSIIGWAGGISIFLACLGLFGLAALAAINRTKEIGIRKVLGASMRGIVVLLSKDFLKLVLASLIIAVPLAWYFMHKWLQDFAYRISIGYWVFIIAGLLAVIIAFLTISLQALKTATANPVKSLRTE